MWLGSALSGSTGVNFLPGECVASWAMRVPVGGQRSLALYLSSMKPSRKGMALGESTASLVPTRAAWCLNSSWKRWARTVNLLKLRRSPSRRASLESDQTNRLPEAVVGMRWVSLTFSLEMVLSELSVIVIEPILDSVLVSDGGDGAGARGPPATTWKVETE